MHSTAFWCLFVVLLFFWLYGVTTVTPLTQRSKVLRYLACADLSNIFLIQSLLYFQRSPVTRHRRVTYVM